MIWEIILGLIILSLGFTIISIIRMNQVKTDLRHLTNQFQSLATDFKAHRNDFMRLEQKVELSLKKRK